MLAAQPTAATAAALRPAELCPAEARRACSRPAPPPASARPQCLALGAYLAVVLRGRGGADAIAARAPHVESLHKFVKNVALPLTQRGVAVLQWCAARPPRWLLQRALPPRARPAPHAGWQALVERRWPTACDVGWPPARPPALPAPHPPRPRRLAAGDESPVPPLWTFEAQIREKDRGRQDEMLPLLTNVGCVGLRARGSWWGLPGRRRRLGAPSRPPWRLACAGRGLGPRLSWRHPSCSACSRPRGAPAPCSPAGPTRTPCRSLLDASLAVDGSTLKWLEGGAQGPPPVMHVLRPDEATARLQVGQRWGRGLGGTAERVTATHPAWHVGSSHMAHGLATCFHQAHSALAALPTCCPAHTRRSAWACGRCCHSSGARTWRRATAWQRRTTRWRRRRARRRARAR